jgi:hypothetical protein
MLMQLQLLLCWGRSKREEVVAVVQQVRLNSHCIVYDVGRTSNCILKVRKRIGAQRPLCASLAEARSSCFGGSTGPDGNGTLMGHKPTHINTMIPM